MLQSYSAEEVGADPVEWLTEHVEDSMLLLAHADDGVIWGAVSNKEIIFPTRASFVQAEFRPVTLQMARLFNNKTEIYLWRTDERRWRARKVTDSSDKSPERDKRFPWAFDEQHVLWGTEMEPYGERFSLAKDGEEGLPHALPITSTNVSRPGERKLRLGVRHYLQEDELTGWLHICMSRLTGVV